MFHRLSQLIKADCLFCSGLAKCRWICIDGTRHSWLQDKVVCFDFGSVVDNTELLPQCMVDNPVIQSHEGFPQIWLLPGRKSDEFALIRPRLNNFVDLDPFGDRWFNDGRLARTWWSVYGRAQEEVVEPSSIVSPCPQHSNWKMWNAAIGNPATGTTSN